MAAAPAGCRNFVLLPTFSKSHSIRQRLGVVVSGFSPGVTADACEHAAFTFGSCSSDGRLLHASRDGVPVKQTFYMLEKPSPKLPVVVSARVSGIASATPPRFPIAPSERVNRFLHSHSWFC